MSNLPCHCTCHTLGQRYCTICECPYEPAPAKYGAERIVTQQAMETLRTYGISATDYQEYLEEHTSNEGYCDE